MGLYLLNGCGNCLYKCCCKCERKDNDCHQCKYKCGDDDHPIHYVCYDCRRAWKTDEIRIWHQMSKRERNEWRRRYGYPSCPQCSQPGNYVNYATRVPKRSDIKAWEILKIIQDPKLFKDSKPNTLACKWLEGDGIGCATHMIDKKRDQFWIPKRLTEIDDWINYMNETKILQ